MTPEMHQYSNTAEKFYEEPGRVKGEEREGKKRKDSEREGKW
jgi:hypothetical protein